MKALVLVHSHRWYLLQPDNELAAGDGIEELIGCVSIGGPSSSTRVAEKMALPDGVHVIEGKIDLHRYDAGDCDEVWTTTATRHATTEEVDAHFAGCDPWYPEPSDDDQIEL